MKIVVYGVTNWDSRQDFGRSCSKCNLEQNLIEWYNRVLKFIPGTHKLFLTTGTYSDPRLNPIPVDLIQIPFFKTLEYSPQNNYFRNGFMVGIWKALLDYADFDLLIQCQTTRIIGQDLSGILEEFMKRDEQLLAPRFTSGTNNNYNIKSIDVGFMVMKKNAALMYAVAGKRQSCDSHNSPMNCEDEAYLMFKNSWWNPWPNIPTLKQLDLTANTASDFGGSTDSWYNITDLEYFKKMPIIAIGKHVELDYYNEWLKANPVL
jgi:hypothetical protein